MREFGVDVFVFHDIADFIVVIVVVAPNPLCWHVVCEQGTIVVESTYFPPCMLLEFGIPFIGVMIRTSWSTCFHLARRGVGVPWVMNLGPV